MPTLKNYHVFISHAWKYDSDYQTVAGWLKDAKLFNCSDYSVPKEKQLDVKTAYELKIRLREQISKASCVLIICGMYTAYRPWIDYEIETAKEMKKPIIGIRPRGQMRIPIKIIESAKDVVNWQSNSVVEAIRKYSL